MALSLLPLEPLGYSEMLSSLCQLTVMMSSRADATVNVPSPEISKTTCKSVSFGCLTFVLTIKNALCSL